MKQPDSKEGCTNQDAITIDRHVGFLKEKKRKRRKRLLIVFLIFMLIIGLGVGYWFYQVHKWDCRIQTQLAEYRTAGQPVDLEDFDPAPTKPEDNAALAYKKAAMIMKYNPKLDEVIGYRDPKQISANRDVILEAMATNAETLRLVRSARQMQGADWDYRMRSPMNDDTMAPLIDSFSEIRHLAKFLCALTIHYHHVGDDSAAIETIQDMLKLGKTTRKMPTLLPYLVAMAIDVMTYSAIEDISTDLKISDTPAAKNAASQPVTRDVVESLIKELLNEKDVQEETVWTLYSERAYSLDICTLLVQGKMNANDLIGGLTKPTLMQQILNTASVKAFIPQLKKETLLILQNFTAYAEAVRQTTLAEAKQYTSQQNSDEKGVLKELAFPLADYFCNTSARTIILHFYSMAERRMAAVALAMRLYEIDHHCMPAKLADLVPKYLPAVPLDPFALTGQTIGYMPNLDRPLLYCVNIDGEDLFIKCKDSSEIDNDDWQNFGIPFYLNGDNPKYENYQPMTQPAETKQKN